MPKEPLILMQYFGGECFLVVSGHEEPARCTSNPRDDHQTAVHFDEDFGMDLYISDSGQRPRFVRDVLVSVLRLVLWDGQCDTDFFATEYLVGSLNNLKAKRALSQQDVVLVAGEVEVNAVSVGPLWDGHEAGSGKLTMKDTVVCGRISFRQA